MKEKPANKIQDLQYFGEFGGVNPSISDSSTYTFLSAKSMSDTFEGNTEGCYLYSRHTSPSNLYLGEALAAMENTESATVFGSGMGAITSTLLQLCKSGDHVVSSRTVYGGTYAFLKNFASKLNITTSFIDITDLESIKNSINGNTKLIYCEAVSNPLLEIADISKISKIAKAAGIMLVVDNTFSPLSILPKNLGADVIIHSITKFINGTSDTIAGVVCGSQDFINQLRDVNNIEAPSLTSLSLLIKSWLPQTTPAIVSLVPLINLVILCITTSAPKFFGKIDKGEKVLSTTSIIPAAFAILEILEISAISSKGLLTASQYINFVLLFILFFIDSKSVISIKLVVILSLLAKFFKKA